MVAIDMWWNGVYLCQASKNTNIGVSCLMVDLEWLAMLYWVTWL